jgi:hypothetical protein
MIRIVTPVYALVLTLSLPSQASAVSYVDDAQPVFSAKCATCHTTLSLGGHSIGTSYADGQEASTICADLTKAACSIERIEDGTMPQGAGCNGPVADDADNADVCVTESEFDLLEAWIAAGEPETDEVQVPEPTDACTDDTDCVEGSSCEEMPDGGTGCVEGHGDVECQNDEDCESGQTCSGELCVGTSLPNPCDACTANQTCVEGACEDDGPANGPTGVGDGYTYEEGRCQAGGGSLGGLMLLLAALSLVATRRRRARFSLR